MEKEGVLFRCKMSLLFSSAPALIPTLFPTVPAPIAAPSTLCLTPPSCHRSSALHLWLSNIILHLSSFSAPHYLNSCHYNQPPRPSSLSCISVLSQTAPPPTSSLLLCSPSSLTSLVHPLAHFINHSHLPAALTSFLASRLLHISLFFASERTKM